MSGERELGFAGMIAAGMTPEAAWQSIRDDVAADRGALALLHLLDEQAVEQSRRDWARYGLPLPWEGL